MPIEEGDGFTFSEPDDAGPARDAVDDELKARLFDDPYELGMEVLEVAGDLEARVQAVLQRIRPTR